MTPKKRIFHIKSQIEALSKTPVKLVAVTKYFSIDQMQQLLDCGINCFGESRIQVAETKIKTFGQSNIEWHLIGHLQTNKARKAVQLFDVIQSIDSLKVLKKVSQEAVSLQKSIRVLIQVNIAEDGQKYGFSISDLRKYWQEILLFQNVFVEGIMLMAPYTTDITLIDDCFRKGKALFQELQSYQQLVTLSMGMSQDFELALKAGSTMIRIGRLLFQEDNDGTGNVG